ncbi:MAG: pyridoxamine 5'-phosphate oxidase family protein [Verrucomicrobiota bacterium]|jgi:general stress protein 26|nr:pyridoxamine 5'-phosphate oxidase family protein [Verrucomicrobiota bacterium]
MTKPESETIDPAQLPDLAQSVMNEAKFPMLSSIDGEQPRLRPVSPVKTDGFIVYVANLKMYHKTQEIAANPNVELCYMDSKHDQVRISGVAEVLEDADELQAIWDANPLLRQYLGTIENPMLIVYRIVPKQIRFMREWALEYHEVDF